jgi:hypothetical protein
LSVRLSSIIFIIWGPDPSGLLSWKNVEFCQRLFCIYWDDHVVFVPDSIYVLYYVWFSYFKPSLYPWNETNLIMVYDLLMCCWIWFTSILLIIFAFMFIKESGLWCSFLWQFYLVLASG